MRSGLPVFRGILSSDHAGLFRDDQRWRRFERKHGMQILFGITVILVVTLVAFLMYMLTSPNWRSHG